MNDSPSRPTWGTTSSHVGPYRLESLLGAGGMGEVWRAADTEHHDRPVAVKVLRADLARSAEFAERFRREAQIAAGLRHPHVIPILRYGEVDGRLYLAMQLVDGEDLSAVLAREGPLTPERAVAVVAQVADVLDAAHDAGLLHRDVKPGNVRLIDRDFVYLLDFGIARPIAGDGGVTATGHVVGTAAYIAPERFGAGPVDRRSDIYSLTGLLYSCLTGSPPFDTDDMVRAAWAHHSAPVPQPSLEHDARLAPFDAVVARGMAKDPGARPATAGELAAIANDAARATVAGEVVDARSTVHGAPTSPGASAPTWDAEPPGPGTPSPADGGRGSGPARRHRAVLLGGVTALVVLLVAVGVTLAASRDTPSAPSSVPPPAASGPSVAPPAPRPVAPAPLGRGAVASAQLGADPFAVALSPDGRFAYAGNENGASVSVVDTTVNRTVATVPTGPSPSSLAVSPDGATLWVATDDGVEDVDTGTNTSRRSVLLDGLPSGLVVSPDGRRLEVSLTDGGAVVELDTASLTPTGSVSTLPAPAGLALGPDGATLAVTSADEPRLTLLAPDGTSTGVSLPARALVPRFAPGGRSVVVTDAAEGTITVVDLPTGAVTATVPAGGPVAAVAFAPDGRTAYAHADGNGPVPGTLLVLDTATWRVRARLPVPAANSADLQVAPDGSRVYVVDQDDGRLLVVAVR